MWFTIDQLMSRIKELNLMLLLLPLLVEVVELCAPRADKRTTSVCLVRATSLFEYSGFALVAALSPGPWDRGDEAHEQGPCS